MPEAAAALRISRTKLYELLTAGHIESVHIGRSRKIPADALTTYLERLRIPTPRQGDTA
ncbi:MAG TPA: helix-turn-helix domain-containing protein [Mycobacteriales bacterium]|nr:helix-turn-helix domain-containing protein [Mycobacteriales bacterium]